MATSAPSESTATRDHILANGQQIMARKGFSAVGLNEILKAAGVPKGSFYHYFGSKEVFGEALLDSYFQDYLAELDETLRLPGLNMAQRLTIYFQQWQQNQSVLECQGKCLAVKLGAEVADLSEAMRLALDRGTAEIIRRLAKAIKAGVAEGSISIGSNTSDRVAQSLYQLWLGASIMVKIVRHASPFKAAMTTTRQILQTRP